MFQGHSIQIFHDDEGTTVMLADFVDRAYVWMVQGGRSACLPPKTFQSLWVLGYVLGQELQCDKATKVGVFSFINHTHPAAAQLFDDPIVGDCRTDELGRANHWREWYDAIVGGSTATLIATSRTPLWLASEWDV